MSVASWKTCLPQRYVFPMQEENQFLEDLFEDLWEAFNTYAFIDELMD